MRGRRHARPHLTPGKEPVPTVQETEWASEPVSRGVENIAPTGIRSPDHPAGSSRSGMVQFLGCCERSNEPSGSLKCGELLEI